MYSIYLLILFLFLSYGSSGTVDSCVEAVVWINDEEGYFIEQTNDDGFFVLATQDGVILDGTDYEQSTLLMKYDKDFNIDWIYLIGAEGIQEGYVVKETSDGGFFILGHAFNSLTFGDVDDCGFFLKFSSEAELEWGIGISDTSSDYGTAVLESSSGKFILGKQFFHGLVGGSLILKYFSDGVLESAFFIESFAIKSMFELSDGSYIVFGHQTDSQVNGMVLKFFSDDFSNIDIYNCFRMDTLYIYAASPTEDGGAYIGGLFDEFSTYVLKFDSQMNLLWVKEVYYDDLESDFEITYLIQSSDGGLVLTGYVLVNNNGDIFVSKISSDGELLWLKTLGTEYDEMSYCILEDSRGGYVITGYTFGLSNFVSDYYYSDINQRRSFDDYTGGDIIIAKISGDGQGCMWSGQNVPIYLISDDEFDVIYLEEDDVVINSSISNTEILDVYITELPTGYGEIYINYDFYDENQETLCKLPCNEGYSGEFCNEFECFEIPNSATGSYCSGNGECDGYNYCICEDNFYGQECEVTYCHGILNNDSLVCGSHGVCNQYDVCSCQLGYFSSNISDVNAVCDAWGCFGFDFDDENVCSGRGICVSGEHCDCQDDYEGIFCETWSCVFDYKLIGQTCSGNGKCVGPGECECNSGYTGKFCDENIYLSTIMAPVLTVSGVGFISGFSITLVIIFFCICSCVCCLICVFCCSVVILSLLICCLSTAILLFRFRVKKFSKLKNFDILLQEQEIEEDTSIAHLKINQILFEVPYDEIKMEKVLGKGGSNSIVYLASWRGTKIAFKCFRVRDICTDQLSFDEFEKEVQIMSSINHPNIVQFLGASLNPPRVGILMEFCENGEIVKFFLKYKKENEVDEKYPIFEKLRMMLEISSSFDYLHSREIIHRDLKSENVLLNSKESCKLMDFGLSKIVLNSQARTSRIGTSVYMAPEIMKNSIYDEKCDVFSFAILMYVMITEKERPYGKIEAFSGVEFKVANDESFRPDISVLVESLKIHFLELDDQKKYSEEFFEGFIAWLVDIVTKCWKQDVNERYSMSELCNKFIEKVEEIKNIQVGKKRKMTIKEIFGGNENKVVKNSDSVIEQEINEIEKKDDNIVYVENEKLEDKKEEDDEEKRILELEKVVYELRNKKEELLKIFEEKEKENEDQKKKNEKLRKKEEFDT